MKVTVNRSLVGARFHVSFDVGDFSQEEISKMESFGVPTVLILDFTRGAGNVRHSLKINQISPAYNAVFENEEQARTYEESVKIQLKGLITELRNKQDTFSSIDEVDF